MVALERDGYLVQPHTSAGRIPTDKGYRFFVDHLDQPGRPRPAPAPAGAPVLRPGPRGDGGHARAGHRPALRPDLLRRRGGRAPPRARPPSARSSWSAWPRCRAAGGRALRRRGGEADHRARRRGHRDEVLATAGACWPPTSSGARCPVRWPVPRSGRRPVDGVAPAAHRPSASIEGAIEADQVFVGGPSRLAEAFDAVETVRSVLAILEQQLVVVTLLRDVLDRGLSVAIGTEHGFEPLASCAVVVAPVSVDGAGPRRGRAARPDPDGLPAGPGRRPRGGRTAGRAVGGSGRADRDGTGTMAELTARRPLRAARGPARRHRRRDQEGLPGPGPRAAPRHQPGRPRGRGQFKEVTVAYEVLRDPESRARYDRFGPEGVFGSAGRRRRRRLRLRGRAGRHLRGVLRPDGGGGRPAPGPAAGSDAEVRLGLEFAEAVFGCRKEISVRLPAACDACAGSGARRRAPSRWSCTDCQGAGEMRRVRQSLLGQVVTSVACARCGGTGEMIPHPCPECRGEGRRMEENTFTVEVPAGVEDGSTLRLAGRGAAGQRGGPPGSLFVHLAVTPRPAVRAPGRRPARRP